MLDTHRFGSEGAGGNISCSGPVTRIMLVRSPLERLARWALAITTLLLMASMGGGFLFLPALIPAHVWAARRSGPVGRVGWSMAPATALAMLTWAAVYMSLGESKPIIWLLPVLVLLAALAVLVRTATKRPSSAALRTAG